MIISYVCSGILLSLSVHASERRSCIDKDPPPEEIFTDEHYGDIGFTRDVCVELGRHLHIKLYLTEETEPCAALAATRTSSCWSCRGRRKWQREDKQKAKVNSDVMAKALAMMQHFISIVAKEHKLTEISDQHFIFERIGTTIDLLKKSGLTLYSKPDEEKKKLIDEIEKLKPAFCEDYLRPLDSQAQKRQANYLVKLLKEFPQEYFQADDKGDSRFKCALGIGRFNGGIYGKQKASEQDKYREIEIEDLSTPEEDEQVQKMNGNGYRAVMPNTDIEESRREIDSKKEQDITTDENQNLEELALHKSIFRNEYLKMCAILRSGYDVAKKDKHGNTALHLAIMLGKLDFVKELVKYGAPITSKNLLGWRPIDEAISYGDLETVKFLVLSHPKQVQEEFIGKRRILLEEMRTIPNFYMELKWEICLAGYRIPYIMPSDVYKIRKRDRSVRMDWTLVAASSVTDFKYGQVALLLDGAASPSPLLYFLDNKRKKFLNTELEDTTDMAEDKVERNAREIMKAEIVAFTVSTSNVAYTEVMSRWSKNTIKTETIASFTASIYKVSGVAAIFTRRTEHRVKAEEEKLRVKRETQKSIFDNAERIEDGENKEENCDRNEDGSGKKEQPEEEIPIPPPFPTYVTWEEYINAQPGRYRTIARRIIASKSTMKVNESTIAMVPNFPITKQAFLRILEVVAPFKQFNKLREFMETKLPPGFPVRLEIPITMKVSARITLLKFETSEGKAEKPTLAENLFKIPEDYQVTKEEEKSPIMKMLTS